jgi:hypothetical protein
MATHRTLRSLSETDQNMLRALAEFYAEYGSEIVGYSRTDLAKRFGVSPVTIDALKAWHTMNNKR